MRSLIVAVLVALLGAPPLLAQDSKRQIRRELKQLAKRRDSTPSTVADLCRRRAILEAGRGDQRLADWYWWVSAVFESWPPDEEITRLYGDRSKALFELRRPAPETRRGPLSDADQDRLARESVMNFPPDPPTLMVKGCKGEDSVVGFQATIDADGHYRAPRRDPRIENVVPPICAYAVLERHRDYRHPLPEGRAVGIREDLKTKHQRRQ